MGHLVRLRTWRFDMDHTQVKYDVVLRENETYEALVETVRGKYGILPTEPVALTYDFPEWMKVPGDYTIPPVDILEDKDVELFMAVRMDCVSLTMCVAFGNEEVGRYLTMRREEFGLTEDGTDVIPPKPIPWRGFRRGGYLQVSEEELMTICSREQMQEIRRTALRLTPKQVYQPLEDIPDIPSESDSSDDMNLIVPNADGMIRLEELPTAEHAGANLTLAIAVTGGVTGGVGGSPDKDKGIMSDEDLGGDSIRGLKMGSSSAYAYAVGADAEQGRREEGNHHLSVGQVFVDRDAFKVHMKGCPGVQWG
ncbi:hypothetical protein Bca52824_001529 [Brassica carinata]|uniref:Ubiquitin-like domain-containing protein n=1 Tax=Brassica carinata TaxID=52824 RepID=A0A8X7WII0_BRACI|nr:hypothetical protein Bca52824_001529 [Brassica carinata]